jgi:hypothetical protein
VCIDAVRYFHVDGKVEGCAEENVCIDAVRYFHVDGKVEDRLNVGENAYVRSFERVLYLDFAGVGNGR